MSPLNQAPRRGGFTLVEMVIAITIIGILGAIVAVFIRAPVQGYADSVERAGLADAGDLAMRRMARDLRLALPNSVRQPAGSTSSIEFLLTTGGGRYLSREDAVETWPVLDFETPGLTFTVVGGMTGTVTAGRDFVAVFNTGEAPADAYQMGNMALVTALSAPTAETDPAARQTVLTMAANPFASQDPPMPSPGQRFQIVSGPVTYSCEQQGDGWFALVRHSGYPVRAQATDIPVPVAGGTGQRHLLAARLRACRFDYGSSANQRSGLVLMALELQGRSRADATVRLVHQVQVSNTP